MATKKSTATGAKKAAVKKSSAEPTAAKKAVDTAAKAPAKAAAKKAPAAKAAAPKQPAQHEDIALTAYFAWIDRGRPHGSHEADWHHAEKSHKA